MSKDKLILVTQNEHKIEELTPVFEELGVPFETSGLEKYEVRAPSVGMVAMEAAKHAYKVLKRPVVVDDTGLYIEALSGFPGPYAAVLRLMDVVEDRDARFDTGVGYADGWVFRYFVGTMYGDIASAASGKGGFGYDPIFIPDGESRTYAELSLDEKVKVSHRSEAFRKFLEWYVENRQK